MVIGMHLTEREVRVQTVVIVVVWKEFNRALNCILSVKDKLICTTHQKVKCW